MAPVDTSSAIKGRAHALRALAPFLLLLATVASVACGGSKPSPLPQASTYTSVMGPGECREEDNTGEPLVVDWRPEQRADLEVAMRSGVAVVRYDCQTLELLPECYVEGSYGFMGVTTKEQVVRFEDADEVAANLPFSGMKLGAELSQGTALDVALVMIGKKMSTRREARSYELRGRCDGATHFVRGVTVGAFVMKQGTKGKVAGSAELFGVGASASTQAAKQVMNKEGRLEACEAANPESVFPPAQCAAPLRMQLLPIDQVVAMAGDDVDPSCPPGFVLAGDKCARPSDQVPHLCQGDDFADCTKQCERRDARSCGRLADMYFHGKIVPENHERAVAFYERACELGDLNSCNTRALFHWQSGDLGRAVAAYKAACDAGNASACANLGTMYKNGRGVPQDEARAVSLYRLACDGGNPPACGMLGDMIADGRGVARDEERARELFERACQGSFPRGCTNLGRRYMTGDGVRKDPTRALELLTRGCDGDDGRGCMFLGHLYADGIGTRKDELKAFSLYQRACDDGYFPACVFVGSMYENGQGVSKSVGKALPYYMLACEDGNDPACDMLAGKYILADGVPRDLDQAARALSFGCSRNDPKNCEHLTDVGRMFLYGQDTRKDPAKAAALLQMSCSHGNYEGCKVLAYMNEFGIGIRRDVEQAKKGYELACRGGVANACSYLAVLMSNGKGTTKDVGSALSIFADACHADDAWGCVNQAVFAAYGIERSKDAKLAEDSVNKICSGETQSTCQAILREDCEQGQERSCTVLGALVARGIGFPRDATKGGEWVQRGCALGDGLACEIGKALRVKAPAPVVLPAPHGASVPIPNAPLPPPARTPLKKAPALFDQPAPMASRPAPSSASRPAPAKRDEAPPPRTEPREEPEPDDSSWTSDLSRYREEMRVEVGAAKWDTEPSSAPAWGGIVALRGFEIAGEGTVGFMTSYDVALGYNEKNQIPHDMAFAMGAGLRFGPVVLAPGLGLGLDGVNGGDANAFRVPTAFYWKLDGRLLLHVGPISLEGQGARVRRGSMLGSANAAPNETRLLGRLHTPILGERRLSLGLELIDYETGKSLTGLLGMHL